MNDAGLDERVIDELRRLARTYARAADDRDVNRFVSVFAPDGVLEVYRPGDGETPSSRIEGYDRLAQIPEALARYSSTHHLVGDAEYAMVGPDRATGQVACTAHHVTNGEGGTTDDVMHIWYLDEYRRDHGRWAITLRQVRIERIETVPI